MINFKIDILDWIMPTANFESTFLTTKREIIIIRFAVNLKYFKYFYLNPSFTILDSASN